MNEIKKLPFFSTYSSAISKLSHGASLFNSNNSDIILFKLHAQENWIHLLLIIQLVESKVKDSTFYKLTSKSDWNISNLIIICSLTIPIASSAIKEYDNFKNRVRRNNNAKDYLHNMKYNEQILIFNFEQWHKLTRVS